MPAANIYTLGFAFQTAKGTPAASPTRLTRVMSADIAPNPNRDRISETGTGRDGGDRYTVLLEVTGGAEFVLRPEIAGVVLKGVMGSVATVGTGAAPGTAPYTHTFTPADDQPYMTIWRKLGNTLWERFDDCKIVSANFTGEAGRNVQVNLSIIGLKPTRLSSDPTGGTTDTLFPFRVPGVSYTVDGAANSAIRQFGINFQAGQNALQTTQIYNSYVEPGLRTIEVSFTEVFQNLETYNKTIYGGAAGTEPSTGIYHGNFQSSFGDMTNGPGLRFTVPNMAFMTAPLTPDPGGDPLQYEVAGEADTPASGSIMTATLVNNVASY